jgi:hypothetical protein
VDVTMTVTPNVTFNVTQYATRNTMTTAAPETTCHCQHCYQPIAFDEEHTGRLADCPHCSKPTTLYRPAPARAIPIADTSQDHIAGVAYIAALVMPIAGLCLGGYLLATKRLAHGVSSMVLSLAVSILWVIILRQLAH